MEIHRFVVYPKSSNRLILGPLLPPSMAMRGPTTINMATYHVHQRSTLVEEVRNNQSTNQLANQDSNIFRLSLQGVTLFSIIFN